jgi:hypothetical protein
LAGVAAPPYHISAGASNRRATIAYLGWRIPLPISAGASNRRATIAYLGWRIRSPISAGASCCHAALSHFSDITFAPAIIAVSSISPINHLPGINPYHINWHIIIAIPSFTLSSSIISLITSGPSNLGL